MQNLLDEYKKVGMVEGSAKPPGPAYSNAVPTKARGQAVGAVAPSGTISLQNPFPSSAVWFSFTGGRADAPLGGG